MSGKGVRADALKLNRQLTARSTKYQLGITVPVKKVGPPRTEVVEEQPIQGTPNLSRRGGKIEMTGQGAHFEGLVRGKTLSNFGAEYREGIGKKTWGGLYV